MLLGLWLIRIDDRREVMRTRHQEMTIGQLKHVVTIADGSLPKVHLEALVTVGIGHHEKHREPKLDGCFTDDCETTLLGHDAVVRVRIGVIKLRRALS